MKKSLLTILIGITASGVNAQTQMPNGGFENWDSETILFHTFQEPVDYNTSTQCTAILNISPVTQSTDAHSGSYSARLETLSGGGNIRANGVMSTAEIICLASSGGQEGGYAYTDEFPDQLEGWYKYAPANQDSAYIQIMFLANNDQDTVCYTRHDLFAAADWTKFTVPLCDGATGNTAEVLSLFFSSSWGDGAQGQAEVGSVLFLDDIEFTNVNGIDEAITERTWTVYPNPVIGELNVQVLQGEEATIEIVDVTGKLVKQEKVNESNQKVDLNSLVTGIYLYQIRSEQNEVLRTGKLLVNP